MAAVFPDTIITTPQGTHLPLRVVMLSIGGVESHWNATAQGDYLGTCSGCTPPDCGGYTSFGYFQVHLGAWASYLAQVTGSSDPCAWATWLKNGRHNTEAAWHLYQAAQKAFGSGLQPWAPDVHGSPAPYLAHVAAAQAALEALSSTGAAASGSAPGPRLGTVPATGLYRPPSWWFIAAGAAVLGTAAIAGLELDWHWAGLREDLEPWHRPHTLESRR